MLGVSHGALQFMTYEEMKNAYNEYRKLPIDTKLVSLYFFSTEIFGARLGVR
jgi:solute carrier family 25 folate transporter 32